MSAVDERQAFVTLAIRDSYGLGCVVLGHAIRNLRTNREIIVLVTDQVSNAVRDLLKGVFDEVITVPILDGTDPRIRRPDLSISLTKIECWNLIQYTKCVYLDPDTLILRNCDELFELDEFSASPDVGWPDCFNTGVFVFKPSKETYNKLITLAREQGSFDGGEHGLLNSFFGKDWRSSLTKRLSYVYNMVSGSIYTYAPAFKRFGDLSKIAHFGGHPKPWLANWHKDGASITAEYIDPSYHHPFLQTWLDVFWTNVYPRLPSVCNELTETGDTFTIWSLLSAMQSPQVYLMARKVKRVYGEISLTPTLPAYYSSPAPAPTAYYSPPMLHPPPTYYAPPPPPIAPPPPSPPPTYYAPPPYEPQYYEPPPAYAPPPPQQPFCATCFMPPPPSTLVNMFFMPRTPPPSKFYAPPAKPPSPPPQQVYYEPQIPMHLYRPSHKKITTPPSRKSPPPGTVPAKPPIHFAPSHYRLITSPSPLPVQPPSPPPSSPVKKQLQPQTPPPARRLTAPIRQSPTASPIQTPPISPLLMVQRSPYRRSPYLPYYPALPPLTATKPDQDSEEPPPVDMAKFLPSQLAKEKGRIQARDDDRTRRHTPIPLAQFDRKPRVADSVSSILSTPDPNAGDLLSPKPTDVKFLRHPGRGTRSLRIAPLHAKKTLHEEEGASTSSSLTSIPEIPTSTTTRPADEYWGAEASRLELMSEVPSLDEQKRELTFAPPSPTQTPPFSRRESYEEPRGVKIPASRRASVTKQRLADKPIAHAITYMPLDKTSSDMLGGLKTPPPVRKPSLQPFPPLTRKVSVQPSLEKIPSMPSTSGSMPSKRSSVEIRDFSTSQKPPPPPPPPLPPPPVVFEPWQPPPPLKVKMPSPEPPRSPPRRPSSASIPVSQPDLFETYRPSQHAIVTPTPSYSDQIQLESRSLSASPVRPAGCCSPSQGRRHSVTSVDKTGPEFMSAKIIKSGVPSKTEMYDKRKSAPSFVPERETHFRPIELPPQSPEAIPSTSTTEDVGVVPEQPFSVPLGVKTESERKGKKPKAYFEEKLPESESVSLKQVKSNGRRVGTTTRVPFPSVETVSENVLRDRERMKDWEEGKVDYLGKDKFENIQKKLDALMADRRGRSKSASDEDEEELTSWRMDTSSVESSVSSTPDMEEIREEEFVPLRSLKSSEDQVVRRNTSGIPGSELGDYTGMRDWEQGNIDVDGRDNSDNIIKRLDFLINQPTSELVNKWKSK